MQVHAGSVFIVMAADDPAFVDASFGIVVSSVAIHNIDEAWRVLRRGGRLLLVDISKCREYQKCLATLGIQAECRSLGWRMWWGGYRPCCCRQASGESTVTAWQATPS